jgi:hypothetical protein
LETHVQENRVGVRGTSWETEMWWEVERHVK